MLDLNLSKSFASMTSLGCNLKHFSIDSRDYNNKARERLALVCFLLLIVVWRQNLAKVELLILMT